MAKIIFLFPNLKITTASLEDLELTEKFLNGKEVDKLAEAYRSAEKNYKFV